MGTRELAIKTTICRIKYFGEFVRSTLGEGFDQHVYFGSGYDTMYLQHARDGTAKSASFFEIELPDVMEPKRNLAKQLGIMQCPIHFISGDLNSSNIELLETSPFNGTMKTSFLE